jgi:hypothetical protein
MAIQSQDNLIASLTGGKSIRHDWNKITGPTAYTAGRWYDFSQLAGLPVANTYAGTALSWTAASESNGFSIPHGGNVTADFKHLLNMAAWTTSNTGAPGTLQLVDLQGYWPGISLNTAAVQPLTGTPTLRYTNGAGLRLFLAATANVGATGHNLSVSYTNQAGVAGRTLPVTVAGTASAIAPHILHSGTGSNNYGPFLPVASGDSGIQNAASVTLSAASGAGTAALVLARPLAQITLSVSGLMTEKDLLNQIPSLPRIMDGACLTWLYAAGNSTGGASTFAGSTEFVWG